MDLSRRAVVKTVAGGTVALGVTWGSVGSAQTESEVVSEITLPEGDARGLGAYSGEDTVFTVGHTLSQWYYIETDGSVSNQGTLSSDVSADGFIDLHGFDADDEAVYAGQFELQKYVYDADEPVTVEMPDDIRSLATDQDEEEVWVGGRNGSIWRVNRDTLEIQETIDFGSEIFGLAHDGEALWVGDEGGESIVKYDPATDEQLATYEYPNAQTIYDYAFTDGRLWLLGDDRLYETDIDGSAMTTTETSTTSEQDDGSEISLPEGDARGLGSASSDGSTYFSVGHTASQWYFIETDGSVYNEGTLDDYMDLHGFDYDDEATYYGGSELRKYVYDTEQPVTVEMPDDVYSIATNQADDEIWVGGGNGNIWRVDRDNLDIEETVDFGESVLGLAHDGESLWVGDSGRESIVKYDLTADEEIATYDYPVDQAVYDFAFDDGRLWLLGDDTIYRTEIGQSAAPNSEGETTTETDTYTAPETEEATYTAAETETYTAPETEEYTYTAPETEEYTYSAPETETYTYSTPTSTQRRETDTVSPTPPGVETDSEPTAPATTESRAPTTTSGGSGPGFGWGTAAVGAATLGLLKLFESDDGGES